MSVFDIEKVTDPTIPVWINNEGYAEKYDAIGQAIDKGCYGEYRVLYVTVDGEGELTIEVSR